MKEYLPFVEMRAVFEKKGAAMYFSHLDLQRAVGRAIRRSHQDVWMTEGFSPRVHLVFTPPLSLGYESECEILDFRLNLGATFDKTAFINAFPPAIPIREVYEPTRKMKEICFARYTLSFTCEMTADEIKSMFLQPVMLVKKTKRSENEVDITKFIKSLEITENNGIIILDTVLACGLETLSPAYIVTALNERNANVQNLSVCRKAFYDDKLNLFK